MFVVCAGSDAEEGAAAITRHSMEIKKLESEQHSIATWCVCYFQDKIVKVSLLLLWLYPTELSFETFGGPWATLTSDVDCASD